MNINLDAQLSGQVFPFMLVFTRLGAGLMMFPGVGEAFVTPRARMMFALALTFLLYPVLTPLIPAIPKQPADLVQLVAMEALVGIFFGSIMRLLVDIVETAGSLIAMDIGLSNAMILNPALAAQSALTSVFLSTAAIALVFVTELDELLFRALLDTYTVFPPGQTLPFGDLVQTFIQTMSKCFSIGVQLASPFIVMGLLIYATMGIMQRLMPQVQLFLVLLPVQIWGGFFVFSFTVAVILGLWLKVFDDIVATLFIR
ncbi:MAG TPA: flagellar biosynthetic protein FliR [Rhodospirillaceae bacterium]|nr:flagellar biosynthetic protein FliR [Rhodospirillaceae bacterium]